MKKWKCTVCGFVCTGDEPPEICPVCKAPQNKFVEVVEDPSPAETTTEPSPSAKTETPAPEPKASASSTSRPAPQTGFEKIVAAIDKALSPVFKNPRYKQISDQMTRLHGHPVMVHIPNGLLPVAVLFMVLAVLFSSKAMAIAAMCNIGVVALSLPLVLVTGWVDWQNRFGGGTTDIFKIKFICGSVALVLVWISFIWLLINPEIVFSTGFGRFLFFVLNFVLLAAAVVAGWYGGKLVFKD